MKAWGGTDIQTLKEEGRTDKLREKQNEDEEYMEETKWERQSKWNRREKTKKQMDVMIKNL